MTVSKIETAKTRAEGFAEMEKAQEIALKELEALKIDPNSDRGKGFLFRTRAFGIMGVQPPAEEKE